MADNFITNAGSGGLIFGSDEIGSTHYPVLKLGVSPADSAPVHVSSANPLPVRVNAGTAMIGQVHVSSFASPLSSGNNHIGKVDITSNVALATGTNMIGKVHMSSMTALTSSRDSITAAGVTDAIFEGVTALVPKFAVISAAAADSTILVNGVSGKMIKVLAYSIVASNAVSAKFEGVSGTALTGPMPFAANGGISAVGDPTGHFKTSTTSAPLLLNLDTAVPVGGHLKYVEVSSQ